MSASAVPSQSTATFSPQLRSARQIGALAAGFLICVAVLPVHLDRAFGLPAHPLLLHVPVIFDPILAVACLVLAARPALRTRVDLAWPGFALVCLFATVLIAGAGQAFIDKRPFVEHVLQEHRDAGETLRLITFGLAAVIVSLAAIDWARAFDRGPRVLRRRPVALVVSVLMALLAISCGFMTVRTGHLGRSRPGLATAAAAIGHGTSGPDGPPIRPGSGQR